MASMHTRPAARPSAPFVGDPRRHRGPTIPGSSVDGGPSRRDRPRPRPTMYEYSPAWPHGPLQPAFPDVFHVVGTNRIHHAGLDIQTSRTMTVVREDGLLTLINTVRLG